jgi:hypothetical protein
MIKYNWAVIKNCRIIGYVSAYSEYDANRIAAEKFGNNIFLERSTVVITSKDYVIK